MYFFYFGEAVKKINYCDIDIQTKVFILLQKTHKGGGI